MQYIYLVRTREFKNLFLPIYKIGRTTMEPNRRLAGYPKGSEVHSFINVKDCRTLEKKLISLFVSKYNQRRDIGTEYFEGDCCEMQADIMQEAFNESFNTTQDCLK